jgi:Asp-tRNA(Asn)/Glu-tRNA(Gln) amidotransferase A subunit family amidase
MTADDQVGPLPGEVFNTSVQNTTGHPALSLPAGRLPNGLPFGLQVTGPRFRDQLLLDLAGAWEQAHPWPRTADGYGPFDAGLA